MFKNCNFLFFRAVTLETSKNRGQLLERETLHTFKKLKTSYNIDTVIIPILAFQRNAQSVEIDFDSCRTPSDFEIENLVDFVERNGARVMFKPTLKLLNDTRPAFIDFFEDGINSSSTWLQWFENYKKFIMHYAKLAQETGVSMFSVGAGLVKSEKKENEWRNLISSVRENYDGFLTYSSERLREDKVPFWDALDFISTDTGYRENNIETQKEILEKLSKSQNKPFALARENKGLDNVSFESLSNEAKESANCCGIMLFDYEKD